MEFIKKEKYRDLTSEEYEKCKSHIRELEFVRNMLTIYSNQNYHNIYIYNIDSITYRIVYPIRIVDYPKKCTDRKHIDVRFSIGGCYEKFYTYDDTTLRTKIEYDNNFWDSQLENEHDEYYYNLKSLDEQTNYIILKFIIKNCIDKDIKYLKKICKRKKVNLNDIYERRRY